MEPKQLEWKGVIGYEDSFEVSNYGEIRSVSRYVGHRFGKRLIQSRILKTSLDKDGYRFIHRKHQNRSITLKIHRVVAFAFVGQPENKPHVNHKDGNKGNNYYLNLEWVTHKENIQHAWKNGLMPYPKGSKHAHKLTEPDILNIWKRIKAGEMIKAIAKDYNVSTSSISAIKRRTRWTHVTIHLN